LFGRCTEFAEPTNRIKLGPDFTVPLEICTSAVGIVGIRGSGKSTTAGVLVEGAITAGVPCAIVDPTGGWYGLKSSADGKSPGLPVYVFGGEHGDLPLDPDAGDVVGRFAVQKRVPTVLDLSLMRKGQRTRFVAAFLERVYHDNREPLLVVIDEAAQFVPQSARGLMSPEIGRCIGAVDDIAALGRRRGLGVVLIGQRPARINKDVLTQCHTLIAMQTTGAPDRKALDEWVKEQHGSDDAERTFLRELTDAACGRGVCLVAGDATSLS
jgi:DNA helicase HerA-like ATPase